MDRLVDGAVRTVRILRRRESRIELRLPDIAFEAIDILQRRTAVEREAVRPEAYDRTVPLVAPPELQMSIALDGMVGRVQIRDLRKKRAGILRQRMQEQTVVDEPRGVDQYREDRKSQQDGGMAVVREQCRDSHNGDGVAERKGHRTKKERERVLAPFKQYDGPIKATLSV